MREESCDERFDNGRAEWIDGIERQRVATIVGFVETADGRIEPPALNQTDERVVKDG